MRALACQMSGKVCTSRGLPRHPAWHPSGLTYRAQGPRGGGEGSWLQVD